MPQFLEQALQKAASQKGLSGKQANGYVFGAMNNMGAMRGSKETPKGRQMDAQHKKDMLKSALMKD